MTIQEVLQPFVKLYKTAVAMGRTDKGQIIYQLNDGIVTIEDLENAYNVASTWKNWIHLKYSIDQSVFFMEDNVIREDKIIGFQLASRKPSNSYHGDEPASLSTQYEFYNSEGNRGNFIHEELLFETADELLQDLKKYFEMQNAGEI